MRADVLWYSLYTLGVVALGAGLCVVAYLDRVYRELGRVTASRVRRNLEVFEAEVEPRIPLDRRSAATSFALLTHLWLVLMAVVTAGGVSLFVAETWRALAEAVFFLTLEVLLGLHVVPYVLLTRSTGRWVRPLVPLLRALLWLTWPLRASLELLVSLMRLSEPAEPENGKHTTNGIEALVEAAEEEGILKPDEADLIEQVVEFSDKRVRELMTPRPDIVAIPADATVEQLRRLIVETKYSRIPVYEGTVDEIVGVVYARDVLRVPEREAIQRRVRDLMRPVLFVPETKLGSQLLKDLQQKHQQLAIVVDEYGSVAGLVTAEDLVEEIVGEIGEEEDRAPMPDVARDAEGALLVRGSVPVEKLAELVGVELHEPPPGLTTVAGLLNHIAGHVPAAGETIEYAGLRFDVLEANQRKVLRLRIRKLSPAARVAEVK